MKATNKINHIFLMVTLIAACFASAAIADSFVNDSVIDSLKDFKFGQAVATATKTDSAADAAIEGDSFVSAAAMETLKDFEFGSEYHAPRTIAASSDQMGGDSFVSPEAMDELEGFVLFKSKRDKDASLSHVDSEL